MAHLYDTELDAFELYHREIEYQGRDRIVEDVGPGLPALGHAVSGAAGSAISTIITYPLSLCVTRLQVQRQIRKLRKKHDLQSTLAAGDDDEYTSLLDAAQKIVRDEGGIGALYAGCVQDVGKTIVDSFLFFLAYNAIRTNRLEKRDGARRLPMAEELGVGMLAGAISRLFTTPVQNVVTRKQTAAMMDKGAKTRSVGEIVTSIREEKGLLGFWSGYSATLVLTMNPALTFLFHESLLRALVKRENRDNPGSRKTFLIAALSKAIASVITYPFSLAKSRSQVSSKQPLQDNSEKVSKDDSVNVASRKVVSATRQKTIFETVLHIAQEEGFLGLYSGLSGEVLKGFFAHGLTMLLKERIHTTVVQTYYFILKLLSKYPSSEELKTSASQTISNAASNISDRAQEASKSVNDATSNFGERASDAAGSMTQSIRNTGEKASDAAGSITQSIRDTASDLSSKARDVIDQWTPDGEETVEKAVGTASEIYRKGVESGTDIIDEYIKTDD